MKKIIFITGNAGKLKEAQSILPEIVGKSIDLPEIQEIDAQKIISAKLEEARIRHKDIYIVEDTSLYFNCLNGLPGPLIKWFLESLGDQKLAEIALKLGNPKAEARTLIGYIDEKGRKSYFEGKIKGKIVLPRGKEGFGWDKIFLPDGYNITFGEMTREEKNKISMRKIALKKLTRFIRQIAK